MITRYRVHFRLFGNGEWVADRLSYRQVYRAGTRAFYLRLAADKLQISSATFQTDIRSEERKR